ncbi:MAG TPA: sortase [Rubrobacteraceae bacterium]|nr:sortase [Rubrobacteraceae bacterium]
MRSRRFGSWTRTKGKTVYYRRRRWSGRSVLVLFGTALILLSVGMLLSGFHILGGSLPAPKDESLRLTVPKMQRVKNVPVYTAASSDTAKLDAGAIHLKDTGYPWQAGSNVYIAGHRLGYARTGSFLLFYDLNRLQDGDTVVLKDTEGRKYIYRVFNEVVVAPDDLSVTKPIAGKSVVSLQACTLPDYSHRLIVQAELIKTVEQPAPQASSG